jgi:hypothetical protein
MDLQLYGRVLWRFRFLVALGLILALSLALVSTVHVGRNGMSYRQHELWSSTVRLTVTQEGFPEGRLYGQEPVAPGTEPRGGLMVDPNRFNALAIYYAEMANSDQVRQVMRRSGPIAGKIIAAGARDDASGTLLPFIDLASIATTPLGAVQLADRGAAALKTYVQEQQARNDVPKADRVVLETTVEPRSVELFQPRSKTMPIVVFLLVMGAIIGLAFLLENLRPRPPAVSEKEEETPNFARSSAERASA